MEKDFIFIISQDDKKTELIKQSIEDEYKLFFVQSETDAKSMYPHLCNNIKIVFIDHSSPDINALELLQSLRKTSPIPEFIVHSEFPNIHLVVECIKNGATDFFHHQINKKSLLESFKTTIENRNFLKKMKEISETSYLEELNATYQTLSPKQHILEKKIKGETLSIEDIRKAFPTLSNQQPSLQETHKNITILLVEDEDDARENIAELLNDSFHTFAAENGNKALEMIQKHPEISIVLLDIYLPDISGTQLLTLLTDIKPDLSIIITSAFKEVDIAVNTLRNGAVDYVNKPFFKKDIENAILKAHRRKTIIDQLPDMQKKIIDDFPRKTKITLINELYTKRIQNNESFYYEDIAAFFPDLHINTPKEKLPEDLSKFDLMDIIDTLKHTHNQPNGTS